MSEFKQIKLPAKSIINRDKLFETDNYLLLVNSSGFNEVYKRLYFKDIQAVHIRLTSGWIGKSIIFWLCFGFFLIVTAFAFIWTDDVSLPLYIFYFVAFFMPTLIFLYFGIITISAGQTCTCTIHTAVQRLKVKAIQTTRQADILTELIDRGVAMHQEHVERSVIIEELKKPVDKKQDIAEDDRPAPHRLKAAKSPHDETIDESPLEFEPGDDDTIDDTMNLSSTDQEETVDIQSPDLEETIDESQAIDLEETIDPEDVDKAE